jgi:hypothetical protein
MPGSFSVRRSLISNTSCFLSTRYYHIAMVIVTFKDKSTERKALGFLLGRFSGRVLKSGEHLIPEAALEALAEQGIPFSVKGKASYAQQVAAIRGATSTSVQRRPRRSTRVAG